MSNFTVNGVYTYTSANIYSYLGRVPTSETRLRETFNEFGVNPTGHVDDLKKLKSEMYQEYSNQVQEQIANQNNQQVIPWAGLCAQIGIQATGNYEQDYKAFNDAIKLLSQSAIDGQAMAYFASLRSEALRVFGIGNQQQNSQSPISFQMYQAQFLG